MLVGVNGISNWNDIEQPTDSQPLRLTPSPLGNTLTLFLSLYLYLDVSQLECNTFSHSTTTTADEFSQQRQASRCRWRLCRRHRYRYRRCTLLTWVVCVEWLLCCVSSSSVGCRDVVWMWMWCYQFSPVCVSFLFHAKCTHSVVRCVLYIRTCIYPTSLLLVLCICMNEYMFMCMGIVVVVVVYRVSGMLHFQYAAVARAAE